MNLFRVDFYQGKTDAPNYTEVCHSLIDSDSARALISLAFSPDALTSVSTFSREPKRCSFSCFIDDWIEAHIMSGEEEHDRYVSHYEVRVYRDSVLVFTGIIDTSQTTWDLAEQIITFSAYSKDKLFTTFSDLESWLALAAGYTPGSLLGVFATVLATKAPIRLNFITTAWTAPSFTIPYYEPLNIAQIDYADMRELPAASDGWSYALVDPWGPHFGYACFSPGYIPFFYFANIVTIKATKSGYADKYILRFRARCCRFYNGIAPVVDSYDHATAPLANTSGDEAAQARNEFEAWIVRHGTTLAALSGSPGLPPSLTLDGGRVYQSQYNYTTDHYVRAEYHGPVLPAKIHPGKSYEDYSGNPTPILRAIQAMLLLYNSTLYPSPNGSLNLVTKAIPEMSVAVPIDNSDIVSLSLTRMDFEAPDTSALEVLAGDTTQLQARLKDYLQQRYSGAFKATATIDNIAKYTLSLLSTVTIDGEDYLITSLDTDFAADEYKVTAWKLPPSA